MVSYQAMSLQHTFGPKLQMPSEKQDISDMKYEDLQEHDL
jgi:hypothetical protein